MQRENPRPENAVSLGVMAIGVRFTDWNVDNVSSFDQRSPEVSMSPGRMWCVECRAKPKKLLDLRLWVNQQLWGFISKNVVCQAGLRGLVDKSDRFVMCSWRACSSSAASSVTPPISGSPSTGTLYEVQLQQLLLHHRRNFQEWCKNSRLAASWSRRYYPLQNGGINSTCLEEQSWHLQPSVPLLFIYMSSLCLSLQQVSCLSNLKTKVEMCGV